MSNGLRILVFSLGLITACTSENSTEQGTPDDPETTSDTVSSPITIEESPALIPTNTVDCDSLYTLNQLTYLDSSLFSGFCSELYPREGTPYMIVEYGTGKPVMATFYDKSGKVLYTESYDGRPRSQQRSMCNCNELAEKEDGMYLENYLFTGVCFEYYDEARNVIAVSKSFKDGQLHGRSQVFDREGKLLVEEIYQEGIKLP